MHRYAIAALACALAGTSHAEVRRGPVPGTTLSRGGTLTWYVEELDLRGRTWGEMDAICQAIPVRVAAPWRAPTNDELRTLFREVPRTNAVTRWTELYLSNEPALTPAIEPYFPNARVHPAVNLVTRDLYTYEGVPTTFAAARRGRMHVLRWYSRSTMPFLSFEKSIRYDPGGVPLGKSDRLLCVAEAGRAR